MTPPPPNNHSAGITDQQSDFVRRYMVERRHGITLILNGDRAWWAQQPETEFTQIFLYVHRVRAFAPYVGPPADYEWLVAMTNDERFWVSGPARLDLRWNHWPSGESPLVKLTWVRWENDLVLRHHDTGKEPQS